MVRAKSRVALAARAARLTMLVLLNMPGHGRCIIYGVATLLLLYGRDESCAALDSVVGRDETANS